MAEDNILKLRFNAAELLENRDILESMLIRQAEIGSRSLKGGKKALYNSIISYLKSAETKVRKQMIKVYKSNLPNDPRAARYSISRNKVKSLSQWKFGIGKQGAIVGAVKILQPKTAGARRSSYVPIRKLDKNPTQRGGNRRPRSKRTESIMSYGPRDRGFILRFLENGTKPRQTRFGNRGSIRPHPIFNTTGPFIVDSVMKEIAQKIDNRIKELMANGKFK